MRFDFLDGHIDRHDAVVSPAEVVLAEPDVGRRRRDAPEAVSRADHVLGRDQGPATHHLFIAKVPLNMRASTQPSVVVGTWSIRPLTARIQTSHPEHRYPIAKRHLPHVDLVLDNYSDELSDYTYGTKSLRAQLSGTSCHGKA